MNVFSSYEYAINVKNRKTLNRRKSVPNNEITRYVMKKNSCKKLNLVLFCLVIFIIIEIPTGFFKAKFSLMFSPDDSVIISYYLFRNSLKPSARMEYRQ